jgi:Aflatoxin regulatory protein
VYIPITEDVSGLTREKMFDRFPNYNLEGNRQTETESLAFTRDCAFSANIDPRLQETCAETEESCTKSILHALQLLCVPPSACLSVSDDSLSAPSSGGSYRPSRRMDDVLTTNRGVIGLVERVLRCSCSTTPSVQLLIVTVCDRLIAWYQAMLRQESQQPPYTHETGGQDEQGEHVLPQPITMGDFSVDPAMQLQIREQLVMGELRRVEEITQLFAARLRQVKSQNSSTQSQKIYDSLSLLLRHQLQVQARVNNGRVVSS